MNEYPMHQIVLNVEDYVYRYLKLSSMVEELSMSALVTVMVDDDMAENVEICKKHAEYIYKNRLVT